MTTSRGKIYLLGGRGAVPVSEYDIEAKSWSIKNAPPIELHHFQAQVHNHKIYVIGAFTGDYPEDTPVSHVYIYDIATDKWQQGIEIPANRRRGAAALASYESKFYLLGGVVNGHLDTTVDWLDEYDPITNKWRVLADAPHKRDHFQAAVVDNALVAVGGRRSRMANNEPYQHTVAATDVFDLESESWRTLNASSGNIPTPRSGIATLNYKNQILVLGGESKLPSATDKTVHTEVQILDLHSSMWHSASPLLTPHHGFQAAIVNDTIYLSVAKGDHSSLEFVRLDELLN